MLIRSLDPAAGRSRVDAVFAGCADHVRLERGTGPGRDVTEEFFTDTPPGCDPAANLRLGQFDDTGLIGIADLAFGFPTATDAYFGLMMIAPAQRGTGRGPAAPSGGCGPRAPAPLFVSASSMQISKAALSGSVRVSCRRWPRAASPLVK